MLWRQGDILIERVETIPEKLPDVRRLVLASGDSTAHKHRIAERGGVTPYRNGDVLFLDVARDDTAVRAAPLDAGEIDAAFDGVAVVRVGLDCDVPTLQQRERRRDGRWGGLVEASLGVHDGWGYDARFDTTKSSAETIAAAVLRLVDAVI